VNLASKPLLARFRPHCDNEFQRSLNDFWSCTLGNQGIRQIYEFLTEVLTAVVLLNTRHKRQSIDSKITEVVICKVIKKEFLDVNYLILIKYNYQSAKARALYKSTDGPAGQPADNPANSDGLADVHRTALKMRVWVNL